MPPGTFPEILWFSDVLPSVPRSAEGEQSGLNSAALAGGVMFVVLETAGASVEIIYPAATSHFESFQPDRVSYKWVMCK